MPDPGADRGFGRLAHDLRTPLNGVLGMLELLLATPLDPGQRHYATTAQAAARAMLAALDRLGGAAAVADDLDDDGAAAPWPGPRLAVLVAEDVAESLVMISAMLERDGHAVTAVRDGRAAVAAAAADAYDVVLLDLFMPGLDGIAATRAIRAAPSPRSGVPIVGLTADVRAQAREDCLAAGMDAVVAKPVTAVVLRRTLAAVVRPAPPAVLEAAWVEQVGQALPPSQLADLVQRAGLAVSQELGAIEARAGAADLPGVARHAHRLAGLAATYGCAELHAAAAAMEAAADAGHVGAMPARLDHLSGAAGRALTALRDQRTSDR